MGTNMFDVGLNWQLLANLSQQAPNGSAGPVDRDEGADSDGFGDTRSRGGARPTRSNKSQSQSGADYAVRHQAAEQRRRARINERLDALRKLVPHDTRSNTASFLEEVIRYILTLKDSVEKLEQALVDAQGSASHQQQMAAPHAGSKRRAEAPPEVPQQLALLAQAQAQAAQMQQLQQPAGASGQSPQPPQSAPSALQGLAETAGALQLQAAQVQQLQAAQQAQQLRQLQGGLPGVADAALLAQAQMLQEMAASQAGSALLQRCVTPSSLMPPPSTVPATNGRVSPATSLRGSAGNSAAPKDTQEQLSLQQAGGGLKQEAGSQMAALLQQQALLQQLLMGQQGQPQAAAPPPQANQQALLLHQFAQDLQAQQVQRLLAGAGLAGGDSNLMLAGMPMAGMPQNGMSMADMGNGMGK